MVQVGTGSSGTRFIKTDWPIEEGLTAGTTKLAEEWKLRPELDLTDLNSEVGL